MVVFCAQHVMAQEQDKKSINKEYPGNEFVKARLVLENTAIASAGKTNLAVIFDISPGWHLYWRNAGDSGLPPRVKFTPIPGVTFGEPQWPVPMRRIEAGTMVDYIYERELVLIFPITTTSAVARNTDLKISAEIDWLVCKDRCVPGHLQLSKSWPVAADAKASPDARAFATARTHHPKSACAGSKLWEATWDEFNLLIKAKGASKLAFFPYENEQDAYPENIAETGESKSDSLRMHYGNDVAKLKQVVGVLAITREGVETFYEITLSPPLAKESTVRENGGRASGKE